MSRDVNFSASISLALSSLQKKSSDKLKNVNGNVKKNPTDFSTIKIGLKSFCIYNTPESLNFLVHAFIEPGARGELQTQQLIRQLCYFQLQRKTL